MDITEFAKAVGVSPATVSYVISGRGRISEKTRRMVQERMTELGYVPNQSARHLASGRSRTVLVPFRTTDVLTDPFLAEVTQAMLQTFHQNGYEVLLDLPDETGSASLLQRVRSRAFAGSVLFEGFYLGDDLLVLLAGAQCPCVVTDPHRMREVAHTTTIVYEADAGMREAARHLVSLRHQRIAVLNCTNLSSEPFVSEATRNGVPIRAEWVINVSPNVASVAEAVRSLLVLPPGQRPTAIFARKDGIALAILRELHRQNVSVPRDISVVGFDDTHHCELAYPSLTSVRLDCSRLGERMATALCERVAKPDPKPRSVIHPSHLVVRESSAPPLICLNQSVLKEARP